MKKYIAYSILMASAALSSCSGSFLEQNPPLYVEPDEIYDNPQRIEAALLGIYSSIKNTAAESFLGGKTYMVFDNRGEDIMNVDENIITLYNTYTFKVNPTDTENTTTWNNAYSVINKANIFLNHLEEAKELVGDKYEQYKAEALFLRALTYYYLNNLYSMPYVIDQNAKSVPLRLMPETSQANNGKERATVSAVYNQILEDLKGMDNLQVKSKANEENVTRATQAAANMLKMRVYMSMQNWEEAIKAGEKIAGYELTVKFADLFSTPYYTDETIFSLPMSDTNKPNSQQGLGEYYNSSSYTLVVDMENGIFAKEGYDIESDMRHNLLLKEVNEGTTRVRLMKFVDSARGLDWVPVFRYAETLLNLAECYANEGPLKNETKARELLKQVRRRSLSDSNDTFLGDAKINALTGNELLQAIYNERRIEFIGEGMRGIDILRRGESFIRGEKKVTPESSGYIWPISQSEQLMNPDLNK